MTHATEISHFSVTEIRHGLTYNHFNVYVHYSDGTQHKLATHQIEVYKSQDLFKMHHEDMIAFYTTLETSAEINAS